MREHPKLFKGNMVRAILEGHKTQTRLPVTFHNSITGVGLPRKHWGRLRFRGAWVDGEYLHVPFEDVVYRVYPRYEVGDHLWVRETWGVGTRPCPFEGWVDGIEYRADEAYISDERDSLHLYDADPPDNICLDDYSGKGWRPSIHMFRWASRINLEVIRRWPEKVQDISKSSCEAEGLKLLQGGIRSEFATLWDSCYGKGAWSQNGYVWAYEFKVLND